MPAVAPPRGGCPTPRRSARAAPAQPAAAFCSGACPTSRHAPTTPPHALSRSGLRLSSPPSLHPPQPLESAREPVVGARSSCWSNTISAVHRATHPRFLCAASPCRKVMRKHKKEREAGRIARQRANPAGIREIGWHRAPWCSPVSGYLVSVLPTQKEPCTKSARRAGAQVEVGLA